jgi:hypothetical protein
MDGPGPERVWVQVIDVDVAADREVTFGRNLAQELSDRAGDIPGRDRGWLGIGSEEPAVPGRT